MKMRSVMQHSFSQVPRADIPRSSFDRSHGHKTTFNAGLLVPIFLDEALPGDTFNLSMTGFARMATPIFPIMDNLFMETFFFAVPMRLVWENWQKFNGEQAQPGDSTDYLVPQLEVPAGGYTSNRLMDYLGVPIGKDFWAPGGTGYTLSALPVRAYRLIYNEWFRDQNLNTAYVIPMGDGPDSIGDPLVERRGKRHDYFTSCLPWPQKGDSVNLPLGTMAPVVSDAVQPDIIPVYSTAIGGYAEMSAGTTFVSMTSNPGVAADGLYADLSTATAATINQIRQAFQIQKLLERDARGGTRYTEIIKAHFGVTSPDARLQRPEYLGGGSSPINITPVAQTVDSGVDALGRLGAFGTASLHNHGFTKSFTEHCIVIGIVCVRADLTYQQGLDRMWSRNSRYDFYWPALAHIGEQAVLNREIFVTDTSADYDVFGYQERYAEYRYKPSRITGLFRSDAAGSLDAWHLSQDFASLPALGAAFIRENPPVDRVIAIPSEPHFIFDSYFNYRCARPMPMFGVPGLIDHF